MLVTTTSGTLSASDALESFLVLWRTAWASQPWVFVAATVLAFLLTILAYLAYSGLFSAVAVSAKEPPIGDLVVAYRTARGPYSGAGALFTQACSLLPGRRALGVYYDDPEGQAPEEGLRYAVGCVLCDGEDDALDHTEMELMLENGFRIAHLPRPNYAVLSTFPFRTTISIYLAISRVYPRLKEYIASRGLCAYPAVEIYEEDHILFMMPLSRQEEWFVPEFSEEEVSIATTEMSTASQKHKGDGEAVFAKPAEPATKKVSSSSSLRGGRGGSAGPDHVGDDNEEKPSAKVNGGGGDAEEEEEEEEGQEEAPEVEQ